MGFIGGVVGSEIGRMGGKELGQAIGKKVAGRRGHEAGGNIGSTLGRAAGGFVGAALSPFATGGYVQGKRGAPTPILAHAGEFVVPLNAKATIAQKRIVAHNKRFKR